MLAAALREVRRDLLPLPEVGVDEPVDQLAHLPLDLARRVGDDLALEALLHARGVEQIEDPADAQHLVEIRVAARLHLEQRLLDLRDAQRELPIHVLPLHGELPIHVVEELHVFREQVQASGHDLQVAAAPASAPTPSGLASFSRTRSCSSRRSRM